MVDRSRASGFASDNDIRFSAIEARFEWTNQAWGVAHLPNVRVASLLLQKDDIELEETVGRLVKAGVMPDTLEGISTTKEHLEALVDLLRAALTRSFVVLERLGYSPDLPPEYPVH